MQETEHLFVTHSKRKRNGASIRLAKFLTPAYGIKRLDHVARLADSLLAFINLSLKH